MHAVNLFQKAVGIPYQILVPGIAGPAEAFSMVVLRTAGSIGPGLMPFHIDYHYVDGQLALAELAAKGKELFVGIRPITAPPVAKNILGRQRNAAGNLGKVCQGGLVIVAVGKEIQVLNTLFGAYVNPLAPVAVVLDKNMARTLIYDGPSVAGDKPLLHRVAVIYMVRTVAAVKGARGSHKVRGSVGAWRPNHLFTTKLECSLKVISHEST